jgi:hypothetical protein|tara:strand:- start:1672 stop:1890 length:219 start_codon:yes stop_codon:yes gene_type:complete
MKKLSELKKELSELKYDYKMSLDNYKVDYENNIDMSDDIYGYYEQQILLKQSEISIKKAEPLLIAYGIELDN